MKTSKRIITDLLEALGYSNHDLRDATHEDLRLYASSILAEVKNLGFADAPKIEKMLRIHGLIAA